MFFMKTKIIIITLLLTLALLLISLNIFQSATGPHDGTVKPAGNYNIEMKNSYDNFYAYLLDKKRNPISNTEIYCEVKFIFPDSTSTVIPLKPFEEDGFSIESGSLKFYSCRIYFKVSGKLISASFDNESLIVLKK